MKNYLRIPKDLAKLIHFSDDFKSQLNVDLDIVIKILNDNQICDMKNDDEFWKAYDNSEIEFVIEINPENIIEWK